MMQFLGGSWQRHCVTDSGYIDLESFCGNATPATLCPEGSSCLMTGMNPNSDLTHFDNIFNSYLSLLIIVSLEGWSDMMYISELAVGKWIDIFFILIVILGTYFVINLVTAVLVIKYQQASEFHKEGIIKMKAEILARALELQRQSPRELAKAAEKRKLMRRQSLQVSPAISRSPTAKPSTSRAQALSTIRAGTTSSADLTTQTEAFFAAVLWLFLRCLTGR